LKTYPFIRIWVAGCSTGEEVYSIAIVLKEEGLTEKSRIYASDFNDLVLERARRGAFPLPQMREYTRNYQKAEGKRPFSDYYTADSDLVSFHPDLLKNVLFVEHNLVTD